MKRFSLLTVFILSLVLTSCFHKDVLNDRADDVVQSFLYDGPEGKFIITREEIFQATSKKSNGGFTSISGYEEFRLSTYDFATGKLLARVELGKGLEDICIVIGIQPGKIWLYSNAEPGLHSRNPKTLEVIEDQNQLKAKAPFVGFQFATPAWPQLNQYYGWDASNNQLMVTDMQGYRYYYDTQKNTLTKTENEVPDYTWATHPTNSNAYFDKENYVSLSSNNRSKLLWQYEEKTGTLSYLNGVMLIDNSPTRMAASQQKEMDALLLNQKLYTDSLNQILAKHPILKDDSPDWSKMTSEERDLRYVVMQHKRNANDAESSYKRLIAMKELPENRALSDEPNSVLIIHATNVSDTARCLLSKVVVNDKKFTETWTCALPNFYRDPNKADSKGAFETVFSEGNPEFDYQWFDMNDGKMVMISQLQMACIDLKTGKKLWEVNL